MAIILNKQDDKDTELNRRITADLRARMQSEKRSKDDPDFAEDVEYVKDLKKTSKFAWVFGVLLVIAIVIVVAVALDF